MTYPDEHLSEVEHLRVSLEEAQRRLKTLVAAVRDVYDPSWNEDEEAWDRLRRAYEAALRARTPT